ncbi:MAG: thiamine pyrophosphate-dependent enzyme [Candidatus Dormiibacterota bacterium]
MSEIELVSGPDAPGGELMAGVASVLGTPADERRRALRQLPQGLALRLYTAMARLRAFDERAVILQRQGTIGTYPPYYGEEAVQAASVLALDDRDWLFPTYRQNAVATLRGCPPESPMLLWRGNPAGWYDVHRYRTAPICVPVATNYPHAVGAAWGSRLRGESTVALAFGGDGSTSPGDFHEACNLAAVVVAPVIFLVTNNQWAISTPLQQQTKVTRLADKATAYGIPGVRVDSFDVFACYEAVAAAAARGRAGLGPTLIEAVGYRLGPHGTADEPSLYRDPERARLWAGMEPLGRAGAAMVDAGLTTLEALEEIRESAAAEMLLAGDQLEAVPVPELEEIADRVHLSTPWTLSPEHLREPSYPRSG